MPSVDTLAAGVRRALDALDDALTAMRTGRGIAEEIRERCDQLGAQGLVHRFDALVEAVTRWEQSLLAGVDRGYDLMTRIEAVRGRSGAGGAHPTPIRPPAELTAPPLTLPGWARPATGTPGGVPAGRPTYIRPRERAEMKRSLTLENDCAAALARHGYRVQQNPGPAEIAQARARTGDTGHSASSPDYLVEGHIFDCYSPSANTSVRNVWGEVNNKIRRQQTQRVVVNLQDWGGDLGALHAQFRTWPINGLKELAVLTPRGEILQFLPHR